MSSESPKVGIGIIIPNNQGKILIEKRIGSHAPKYSIPGGHLEPGETFEQAAIREAKEENDLTLKSPAVIAVTNNLETFRSEGLHYISVIVLASTFEGEPKIMEPKKCADLFWCDPKDVPEPHFDASRLAIQCYLNGTVYEGIAS
jgi:8-oxo-dGTP diphosphatase